MENLIITTTTASILCTSIIYCFYEFSGYPQDPKNTLNNMFAIIIGANIGIIIGANIGTLLGTIWNK